MGFSRAERRRSLKAAAAATLGTARSPSTARNSPRPREVAQVAQAHDTQMAEENELIAQRTALAKQKLKLLLGFMSNQTNDGLDEEVSSGNSDNNNANKGGGRVVTTEAAGTADAAAVLGANDVDELQLAPAATHQAAGLMMMNQQGNPSRAADTAFNTGGGGGDDDDHDGSLSAKAIPFIAATNTAALRIQARRAQQRARKEATTQDTSGADQSSRLAWDMSQEAEKAGYLAAAEAKAADLKKTSPRRPTSDSDGFQRRPPSPSHFESATALGNNNTSALFSRSSSVSGASSSIMPCCAGEKSSNGNFLSDAEQRLVAELFAADESFAEPVLREEYGRFWGCNGTIRLARCPALVVKCLEAIEPDVSVRAAEVAAVLHGLRVDPLDFDETHNQQSVLGATGSEDIKLSFLLDRLGECLRGRYDPPHQRRKVHTGASSASTQNNPATPAGAAAPSGSAFPSDDENWDPSCTAQCRHFQVRHLLRILHLVLVLVGMGAEISLDWWLLGMLETPLNASAAVDHTYMRARLPRGVTWAGQPFELPLPSNGIVASAVLSGPGGDFFVYSNFSCLQTMRCGTGADAINLTSLGASELLCEGQPADHVVLPNRGGQCMAGAGSGAQALREHGVQFRNPVQGLEAQPSPLPSSLNVSWYPQLPWVPDLRTGVDSNESEKELQCEGLAAAEGPNGDLDTLLASSAVSTTSAASLSMEELLRFFSFDERYDERYYEFGQFFCAALSSAAACNEYSIFDNPIEVDLRLLPSNITRDILDTRYRCGWRSESSRCEVVTLTDAEYQYFSYQYCGFFEADSCHLSSHIVRCRLNRDWDPALTADDASNDGSHATSTEQPSEFGTPPQYQCSPDLSTGLDGPATFSALSALDPFALTQKLVARCPMDDQSSSPPSETSSLRNATTPLVTGTLSTVHPGGNDTTTTTTPVAEASTTSSLVEDLDFLLDQVVVDCDGFNDYLGRLLALQRHLLQRDTVLWYAKLEGSSSATGFSATTLETDVGGTGNNNLDPLAPPTTVALVHHQLSPDVSSSEIFQQQELLQTCLVPSIVFEPETSGLKVVMALSAAMTVVCACLVTTLTFTILCCCAHRDNPHACVAYEMYGHNIERSVAYNRANEFRSQAWRDHSLRAALSDKKSLFLRRAALVRNCCSILRQTCRQPRPHAFLPRSRVSRRKVWRLAAARYMTATLTSRRLLRVVRSLHPLLSVSRLVVYASVLGTLRCFLPPTHAFQFRQGAAWSTFEWDDWGVVPESDPSWFFWPTAVFSPGQEGGPGLVQILWGAAVFVVVSQIRFQWGDAALLALFNSDLPFLWLRPALAAGALVIPLVLWVVPAVSVVTLSELRHIGNAATESAAGSWWDAPVAVHLMGVALLVEAAWLLGPCRMALNEILRGTSTYHKRSQRRRKGKTKTTPWCCRLFASKRRAVRPVELPAEDASIISNKPSTHSGGKDANASAPAPAPAPAPGLASVEAEIDAVVAAAAAARAKRSRCSRFGTRLFGLCGSHDSVHADEEWISEAVPQKLVPPPPDTSRTSDASTSSSTPVTAWSRDDDVEKAGDDDDLEHNPWVARRNRIVRKNDAEIMELGGSTDIPKDAAVRFVNKRLRWELLFPSLCCCGGCPVVVLLVEVATAISVSVFLFGWSYDIDYGDLLDLEFAEGYGSVAGTLGLPLLTLDQLDCFHNGQIVHYAHLTCVAVVSLVALAAQAACCRLK